MVLGLSFGAGAAISGAGAGAPVAPALATGLLLYLSVLGNIRCKPSRGSEHMLDHIVADRGCRCYMELRHLLQDGLLLPC